MSESKYSAYELVSPKWIDEEFFENVLKQSEGDDSIKVTSIRITPAAVNNDHYGSLMYRVKIVYRNTGGQGTMSVVLKTMPETDCTKKEMIGDKGIFENEVRMYREAIPRMEEELRKYGDNTKLAARVLYSSLEPHQVMIFEDLAAKGYSTLKNRMPTNEELRLVLLKLSKWHAVSYKLAQEVPELITTFNEGIFNMDIEKINFFSDGLRFFVDDLLASDVKLKEYIPQFEKFNTNILERCRNLYSAFKRGDKAIFVLNHGDVHVKNMMFKHSQSGEVEDVMIVDFQCSFYGPLIADLIYSMFMLWGSESRRNNREEMLHFYFSNFTDSLKKFKAKGELPKMADLQSDLNNGRGFELYLLEVFIVITIVFTDDSIQLDNVIESPEYLKKLYTNPKVIEEVKMCLPYYLGSGYLD